MQEKELIEYLKEVDKLFPIPISQKVELASYAHKLIQKATLCPQYMDGKLVGLVAGYTDNIINGMAYIAMVSVSKKVQNQGIAKKLIKKFCVRCEEKKIKKVHLYTDSGNDVAIKMYNKLGFKQVYIKNDPRPKDVHFILEIEKLLGDK